MNDLRLNCFDVQIDYWCMLKDESFLWVECRFYVKMNIVWLQVYFLSLHWSDGRVSEVEKPHSAFVDLRVSYCRSSQGF